MGALLVVISLVLAPLGDDTAAKLASKDWKVRGEGFQEAMRIPVKSRTGAIRLGLIGALERENALVAGVTELGEDFSTYYSELIEAVAGMKDPRAANALLGALGTGTMAADGLIALGEAAVDPAIERLRNTESRRVRRDTCNFLRRLAEPAAGLNEETRNRIGAAMAACKQ
jgi:hypothetical protein